MTRAIVFTRTKRGADRVALQLNAEKITAAAMHGNLGQNARQRALEAFKSGACACWWPPTLPPAAST